MVALVRDSCSSLTSALADIGSSNKNIANLEVGVEQASESENWNRAGFPSAQTVKNMRAMRETWVLSLGWEDPLERGMVTYPSIWPG